MNSIRKDKWIFNSLYAILISTYVFFLSFSLIHTFSHLVQDSEEHSTCSVENENDSCHQFVYHNNQEVECEHDGHLIEYEDHCDICAIISSPTPQNISTVNSINLNIYTDHDLDLIEKYIDSFNIYNVDVRGPPNTII